MAILRRRETWKREQTEAMVRRQLGTLTIEEQSNVRKAIRALRVRLGSNALLAEAMGMSSGALHHAAVPSERPSACLAMRVARVAGVPVGDVLSGAWPGRCPACGRV